MKKILMCLLLIGCNASPGLTQDADVNYIILKSEIDNINKTSGADVLFFIPVADSNNFAGVNFRTVVLRDSLSVNLPEWIAGALKDSVNIGAFIVHRESLSFDPDLTKGQKASIIDNRFNVLKTTSIARFYARYDFYGFERVVQ